MSGFAKDLYSSTTYETNHRGSLRHGYTLKEVDDVLSLHYATISKIINKN